MFTLAAAVACVFQVHTIIIANTYMLYIFDMATDQGRILKQAGVVSKTGCHIYIHVWLYDFKAAQHINTREIRESTPPINQPIYSITYRSHMQFWIRIICVSELSETNPIAVGSIANSNLPLAI